MREEYTRAVGVDINEGMLAQFEAKIAALKLGERVQAIQASAMELPLKG